jgi:hypothetical protein
MRWKAWLLLGIGAISGVAAIVAAEQRGRGLFGRTSARSVNVDYNGRFTFTRISYGGGGFFGGWWNHDYPQADTHLSLILDALTSVQPNLDGSYVLDV